MSWNDINCEHLSNWICQIQKGTNPSPLLLDRGASFLTPPYVPSVGTNNKQKYQHQGSVRPLFHKIKMKALSTDKCSKGTEDQKATRESWMRVVSSERFPPAVGTLATLCRCRGEWVWEGNAVSLPGTFTL